MKYFDFKIIASIVVAALIVSFVTPMVESAIEGKDGFDASND